jgi:hypothetical protein
MKRFINPRTSTGDVTMKKTLVLALLLAVAVCFGESAFAQAATSGKVTVLFADPNDFVVELDTNGRCGSAYFHIQRSNANFKEMTAVALTAFTTGKTITFFVASCNSKRNIISHGYVSR